MVIERLQGFPDNVAAFALHGHVTKTDYRTVLVPDLEDRLARHQKVRIYCEIPHDFQKFDPGALWEDSKFGFGHVFDWERAALVTDVEWMSHVAKFSQFFGFLWPGQYRAFPNADVGEARKWITEPHE
ncbi:STAS/SEC14 domain-containing protein [Mycobacterium pseudokansasii]|uniref:STAS/SEC14 domain-containing protein n=1 Tax=Mycobacterium pseudokansasii TaxID=2341080 RepID=UPI001FEAE7BE|nr:STAS/SEC14 domain-containing protein [Mycobacterium pseudokansasii]